MASEKVTAIFRLQLAFSAADPSAAQPRLTPRHPGAYPHPQISAFKF